MTLTRTTFGISSLVLVISLMVCVSLGPADIAPSDVWRSVLARFGWGETTLNAAREGIVWHVRFPRALTAVFVGAGLALCGAVMQSITRNPIADPYLLGLSAGASIGAVIVIVLGFTIALPVAAFVGALIAMVATLTIAGSTGQLTATRTILAGLAVSAFFSALASLVIFWAATGDTYREILGWLLGSLAGASWISVAIAGIALAVIAVPMAFTGGQLDAFSFGDRAAVALGVNINLVRWVLLGACAVLTGAMVSVSGSIGFVGLVIPHAVRLVIGVGNRLVLPMVMITGGTFLLWADTFARTLADPRELPVGVVTAIIGGPVFAVLLLRRGDVR